MTTIATDGKIMAADSLVTLNGERLTAADKVYRVGDALVGMVGMTGDGEKFLAWARAGMPAASRPELNDDFAALSVSAADGVRYWDAYCFPLPMDQGQAAIGTGAGYALGALAQGADVRRAVKIACKYDTNSGGAVVAMSIEEE